MKTITHVMMIATVAMGGDAPRTLVRIGIIG